MPDVTFVKNGNIVYHNNETSLVASDQTTADYWTEDKIIEFKNNLRDGIILLNNDIVEGVE